MANIKKNPIPTAPDAFATSDKRIELIDPSTGDVMFGTAAQVVNAGGSSQFVAVTETVNANAAAGTTETIPEPAVASLNRMTLSANCVYTFPTAAAGKSFTLVQIQDTTPRTVTWPGTVKWQGGVAPTLSTGSGAIDVFTFMCADGTNWLGFVAGQAMA